MQHKTRDSYYTEESCIRSRQKLRFRLSCADKYVIRVDSTKAPETFFCLRFCSFLLLSSVFYCVLCLEKREYWKNAIGVYEHYGASGNLVGK